MSAAGTPKAAGKQVSESPHFSFLKDGVSKVLIKLPKLYSNIFCKI